MTCRVVLRVLIKGVSKLHIKCELLMKKNSSFYWPEVDGEVDASNQVPRSGLREANDFIQRTSAVGREPGHRMPRNILTSLSARKHQTCIREFSCFLNLRPRTVRFFFLVQRNLGALQTQTCHQNTRNKLPPACLSDTQFSWTDLVSNRILHMHTLCSGFYSRHACK